MKSERGIYSGESVLIFLKGKMNVFVGNAPVVIGGKKIKLGGRNGVGDLKKKKPFARQGIHFLDGESFGGRESIF